MPTDLVIDLADPDTYRNGPPHAAFAELRATAPVHRQPGPPGGEGFWAVLKHADVELVARQPGLFSSAAGGVMMEDLEGPRLDQMRGMLLGMDPPRHREVRRPLTPRLTPRAVAGLAEGVRTVCREVLADVDGEVEFVGSVAAHLPTRVVGQLMGLPRPDWERVHALAERITRGQDPDYAAAAGSAAEASREMGGYAYRLAVERGTSSAGRDDLTAVLLAAMGPAEFATLFVQLVTAGQDTTQTLLSSGLLALLQHPEQLAALRADPSGIPLAVEEMLRWANPLHYFRRTATADAEIRGVPIAAGDKVVMVYTSANRDEDVFAEPDAFLARRSPNRHLSFGYAEHFCVGAHLARLEARLFFEELLARYRRIELTGQPHRLRSNLNNSYTTMPVTLTRRVVNR